MSAASDVTNQWSSRLAFILAAVGSAVGLGNIWKFPYITGEYGGGAFVLVYLACIALIGIPIMMAEILLGRRGQQSPINTMRSLAAEQNLSSAWSMVGWLGVITGFLILSFYSVVAGWAIAYVVEAATGSFDGLKAGASSLLFSQLTDSPQALIGWHTLFMLITMFVVASGVRAGLERLVTILMPMLFLILGILVIYAMYAGEFMQAFEYMFAVNFQDVFYQCEEGGSCQFTAEPLLVAMGHAFFTLSLGMGAIMVYGAYMPKSASIAGSTIYIALFDTLVALMAGLAIFPLVFANGLEVSAGPSLVFVTLPIAFGAMPMGQFFGMLFFMLLVFAAWSSAISLVEPAVAYLVESKKMARTKASLLVGGTAWLLGVGSALSFNLWSGAEYQFFGKTLFDLKDYFTANIALPLGGLFIALFVGMASKKALSNDELAMANQRWFALWWFVIRFIAPIGIALVFLHAIKVL